jgi:hypothetical protein
MKRILSGLVLLFFIFACKPDYTPEQMEYISTIKKHRSATDEYMENNSNSPFNFKGKVEFHPLNYFDVDPEFKFSSKLYVHNKKDTIAIYGTKGEKRTSVRYGYVQFSFRIQDYKLNVYQSNSRNGNIYYSIWFTDKTTNELTYGVGRYLDFDISDNPDYIYDIDFNMAYNPYCAYSKEYSCAIPTKDDYLDLAVTAGEKKFHD